ncbi:MAG: hypothetical protein JWR61_4815 [Ferruginibacter sp.]|uniref:hypothetical protein n=1 Tax=Ferruginibacter sp. TaxID=1940288 RepID=UPI002659019F|nr:hypothetical protein [Ferruginibacter sp.]MDB5279860.1 hypothetical protein [Ferruginibacter sp.]
MKTRLLLFFGLLIHCCTANICMAQTAAKPADKLVNNSPSVNFIDGTPQTLLFGAEKLLPSKSSEAVVSDTTGQVVFVAGNNYPGVYKLPIDNMPCLLPGKDFHSNMPTLKQTSGDLNMHTSIPNPFKKEENVPASR